MPSFCAVLNCHYKYARSTGISFHRFPLKRSDICNTWMKFVERGAQWRPSKWSCICSAHFREDDFHQLNGRKVLIKTAVPSIMQGCTEYYIKNSKENTSESDVPKVTEDISLLQQNEKARQIEAITQSLKVAPNQSKLNCRLCGKSCSTSISFYNNFEIFGMIQKCFPTLNIQQNDNLPNEMCLTCLKRLESFSQFIDEVVEHQSKLVIGLRSDNKVSNRNNTERSLKIKQEPGCRVKQEVNENLENFLMDDVDMAVDDSFDHENDDAATVVDQKYELCNFPMLNAQEIINNCDIMEIINLDDPFIDIPDDDGNTNCDSSQLQKIKSKSGLCNAQELLLEHLLIEEHNYAHLAEDFKEDFALKKLYKTEKFDLEGLKEQKNDLESNPSEPSTPQNTDLQLNPELVSQEKHPKTGTTYISTPPQQPELVQFKSSVSEETRASKPIVTSVSSIANDTCAQFPLNSSVNAANNSMPSNNINKSYAKPNIVVLNDSVVNSSLAFQLQTCNICQLKFITLEALNQHYSIVHGQTTMPMVSVPSSNIMQHMLTRNDNIALQNNRPNKEEQIVKDHQALNIEPERSLENLLSSNWNGNAASTNLESLFSENLSSLPTPVEISNKPTKNKIDILDMQRTFLGHHDVNILPSVFRAPKSPIFEPTKTELTRDEDIVEVNSSPIPTYDLPESTHTIINESEVYYQPSSNVKNKPKTNKKFSNKFMNIQRLYWTLQRRCVDLKDTSKMVTLSPIKKGNNDSCNTRRAKFLCRFCKRSYRFIMHLLRHKQSAGHFISKPKSSLVCFNCSMCEQNFYNKTAFNIHRRFICKALLLHRFVAQSQIFQCRCCRIASFSHWRIFRSHEMQCRNKELLKTSEIILKRKIKMYKLKQKPQVHHLSAKKQPQILFKNQNRQRKQQTFKSIRRVNNFNNVTNNVLPFACDLCDKAFSSLPGLTQHSITHSNERNHECAQCQRTFKRRNGLMQHMKSYHLGYKPHICKICKYAYALKCDMQRCKHSTLRLNVNEKRHLSKHRRKK